jgi:hypothetical protein
VGIVKKNAIMMIDFALEAQRKGKNSAEAIYEGCLLRFRPIMMTTMAALMSAIPIAIGYGAGGEARRPLGLSVVGGLVVSQLLTLYITPVIYLYLESFSAWVKKHLGRKSHSTDAEVGMSRCDVLARSCAGETAFETQRVNLFLTLAARASGEVLGAFLHEEIVSAPIARKHTSTLRTC